MSQKQKTHVIGKNSGGGLKADIGERPSIASAVRDDLVSKKVHIEYGANDLDLDVAGYAVSKVRNAVTDALNVDPQANTYVNGQVVDGDYILKQGDRLEFIKEAGQKGFSPPPPFEWDG